MSNPAAPAKPRRRKAASKAVQPVTNAPRSVDTNPIIRDAVIRAAVEAGEGDMVAYLKKQAETHPSAFLTLLGKVLPMQLTGGRGEPVDLRFSVHFVTDEPAPMPAGRNRTSDDKK